MNVILINRIIIKFNKISIVWINIDIIDNVDSIFLVLRI